MKKMIAILCVVVLAASALVGVTTVRSSNRIKDLNSDLSAMQEAMNASLQNIETLTADVASKTEEIKTLTDDVAAKAAEIETLTADAAAKAEEIRTLTQQAAASQEQIALLTAQAAEAQERIDALTAESAEKTAAIEVLTGELGTAQQKLQMISDMINGVQPQEETAAPAALPQVGDVISGFEVKEIRDYPLIGASLVLFEHQQTGALAMYIANSDTNRVFDLVFKTRPTDNTGLPHVFEHATLSGSEKYPSSALWFNLSYQTYNTYMNASTYDAMTTYPVASLSEAQLLKYADLYTDSCLHPMILQNENIYRTEAWRYRMASMEDDLTIEGTVYSEMKGAYNINQAALLNANRLAFPGAAIGLCQGGDPDYIPDMTWDDLKAYHDKFYHPSNSIAYLYGEFSDYAAFLSLLDAAYAPYEKQEFTFEEPDYAAITASVVEKLGFPVTADSSTENQSVIYYYIPCPGMKDDPAEAMQMNLMSTLLNNASSPLMQNLKKALPSGSFSCGVEVAAPDLAYVFVAQNVNENDGELFKTTVDDTLRALAETGFSQDMMDAVVTSLQLSQRLVGENENLGVKLIPDIAYSYVTSGNVFDYFEEEKALDSVDEWNKAGVFQAGITKWLLDKEATALVTTYPVPGGREEADAALAAKLAEIKAAMSDEEKQAIIDFTNNPPADEDASALVAQLQAVTVESLPEEMKTYPISDETGENGIRRLNVTADLDGVGRANIYLDASGVPQEDILWVKLFSALVGQLDTSAHTKEELDVLTARYLYNGSVNMPVFNQDGAVKPVLRMGWTSLDDDLAAAYDLVYELVYDTQFTDLNKLTEKVSAAKTSLRASLNSAAYNVSWYRAMAVTSDYYRYVNYTNYLEYYTFLEQVEAALAENPQSVADKLTAIQASMKNKTNAILSFVGNEASIALNQPLADAFADKLDAAPIEPVAYDLPVPAAREAVIVDSNVQFNGLMADYATLGMEGYDASLNVITTLVSDLYLIPQLRDQYGVYTPWAGAIDDYGVYLLTYRDPNIVETYGVYESLADQIDARAFDQETLNGYILNAYSSLAKPQGELTGALNAMTAAIEGRPQDESLTYMRQLKAVTPETVSASVELFRKLAENGMRHTTGSAAAINAHAELYDAILNPFGAKDNSQVTLTDVAEGSEHYEAVRFVFENGLMAPKTEDTFGVDEEANVGDLTYALCILAGLPVSSPEEAVATLGQYGIVPADTDASTALSMRLNDTIFVAFGQAVGLGLQADEPNETYDNPMTRGELAEQIKLFTDLLQ